MLRRLVIVALCVAACSGETAATTTLTTPQTTIPAPTTTTTVETLEYVLGTCESPPVSFSAFCEVYDLLDEWHVDRPLDDATLVAAAVQAIESFETDLTAEPPRSLQCAIPSESFEEICAALAGRVLDDQIPVPAAMDAAVVALATIEGDPFSYYVPADQVGGFRQNGIVGGVGILLDATNNVGSKCAVIAPNCPLEIVGVLDDNPGVTAGLVAGDLILAVDGVPVEGQGFAATASAIAGDESGSVELTITRDSEEFSVTITRMELAVPTVIVDVPVDDVGYLKIPDFESDIPGLVTDALTELAPFRVDTLVVDLRDNPGGFIDSVVEVTDQFMDEGLVLISDAPDEHIEYQTFDDGLATRPELVVLVNGGSASAAEVLASVLRERREATIVGSTTFGKDAIQIPFDLRNGGEMTVVVARWTTPDGNSVGGGGLMPDVEFEFSTALTTEELVQRVLDATS